MTEVVLFDLDNTLHDFGSSCRAGLRELARVFPDIFQGTALDELFALYAALLEETFQVYLQGGTTIEGSRAARMQVLFAHCGREVDLDTAAEAYRIYKAAYISARRAYPEVPSVLEALSRTHRLAIVSNGTQDEQHACARQIGALPFMEFVLTPDRDGSPKPDPAMIHAAASRMGVDLEDVTMVGDSWHSDVGAALAAGVRPVWLNRERLECPDAGRVLEIHDLRPLPGILQ